MCRSQESDKRPINIRTPSGEGKDHFGSEDKKSIFEEEEFRKDVQNIEVHKSPSFMGSSRGGTSSQVKSKNSQRSVSKHQSEEVEKLNKAFDRSQEESLAQAEISDKLELERKKELEDAGRRLKLKMFKQHRCYLCTLAIPCSHFSSIEEAYSQSVLTKESDKKFTQQVSQIIEKSQDDTLRTINKSKSARVLQPERSQFKKTHQDFLKKGDGIQPGTGIFTNPSKEHKIREDKNLHNQLMHDYVNFTGTQTVRIRKGPGKYEIKQVAKGSSILESDAEQRKRQQQKEDRERAVQLAKLMKYKEEKLKQEQEQLEFERKMQERQRKQEMKMIHKHNLR